MSDDPVPNDDDAAARLEAALERIAAAARPAPALPPTDPGTASQHQAAAQLDDLIARLRTQLDGFNEPAVAPGFADPAATDPDED